MSSLLLISCIRFSIQLFISELPFLIGKPKRVKFGMRLAGSLAGYAVLAGIYYFLLHRIPGTYSAILIMFWLGLFILTMCVIYIAYDFTIPEVLFVGIGGYATEHMTFCVVKIIQFVTNTYAERIGVVWENLLYRFLPYAAMSILVYYLIIKPHDGKGEVREHDRQIILLSLIVLSVAIILSVFTDSEYVSSGRSMLRNVIAPLYSIICCILVIMIEFYVTLENKLTRENENMERLLQMAQTQQKSSKEAIDIINMKCHDLKHQMKALMTMEDAEERGRYIKEMREAVSIYDATFHTGNDALDYVLREKMLLCEEYHISFSCMADGKELSFIRPVDIYAMMGNALDNAIESVLREAKEKRLISLHISNYGQMLHIHIENTCNREVQFQEGMPLTDKKDKSVHGFGVKSISYIVEKYNGELMMRQKNGKFALDILFPEQ